MNPFKHRPALEHHDVQFEDWEDNALSNFMAWFSDTTGLSTVAQNPDSFMTRLTLYLWSDCPTCLFWRGVTVGAVVGLITGFML